MRNRQTFEHINTASSHALECFREYSFEYQRVFKSIQDILNENRRLHELLLKCGYEFEHAQPNQEIFGQGLPEIWYRGVNNRQCAHIHWRDSENIFPEITIQQLVPLQDQSKGREYLNLTVENLYGDSLTEDIINHYKKTLNEIAQQQSK